MNAHLDPDVRHDFVLLFDITDGNPNGDPDAGNQPRTDPLTNRGLVTDVCIKRKIRNWVAQYQDADGGYDVYVRSGVSLNDQHARAYQGLGIDTGGKSTKPKDTKDRENDLRGWMCKTFFDVRMFGAVMSTNVNAGRVQGPVQLEFGRSVEPVYPQEHTITRVAGTKEVKDTEMGSKWTIPYGLYVLRGHFSANLASRTGVTSADMAVLWDALQEMFDDDRSAARSSMAVRGLYIWSHSSARGDERAHKLFESVEITNKNGDRPAQSFSDFVVTVGAAPEKVTLTAFD